MAMNGKVGRAAAAALLALGLLAARQPGPAAAAKIYPSAGGTSAAFLKLGAGARAAALAGAFAGVPGDPFSVHWNPAGLAYSGGERNLAFYHNEYFQGLGQEALAYNLPWRGGGLGLGLIYFYTPKDMERRSGLYEADPLNPISPSEGKFGAYDAALSAGYARRYGGGLSLGAGLKLIRQSVDDESGSSFALDLGALREFSWRGGDYTAGLLVQNLGPGIKFVSRRYGLPLAFKAGLSRRFGAGGALAAVEVSKPVDNYPSLAAGVEYPLTGRLALRSGYRLRQHGNELGAWSGFSAGAGVAFDRLTFDYAFTPFGVLGNSHRFAINLRFGEPPEAARAAAPAAPPAPAPEGYSNFAFSAAPRPLSMSPRGVRYAIKAVSPDCGLASVSYKAMLRGEAPAEFRVAEGLPPGGLRGTLPPGVRVLKAWLPGELPGEAQGELAFELRFRAEELAGAAPVFLYLKGDKWEEAPASPAGEGEGFLLFSARAPFAREYAAAVKDAPRP